MLRRWFVPLLLVCLVAAACGGCVDNNDRKTSQGCADDFAPTADTIQSELESLRYPLPPRVLRSTASSKINDLTTELFRTYEQIDIEEAQKLSSGWFSSKSDEWEKKRGKADSEFAKRRAKVFEEDQAIVDTILSRGALNDAVLCLWDLAERTAASGDLVKGRLAYMKVQRYTYALAITGRTHGVFSTTRETIAANFFTHQLEFWSPAYEASMQLIKRSGEVPCSGCGPGGIFLDVIWPLMDRFSGIHFPHLTAKITNLVYGQTTDHDIAIEGSIAEIPENVYKDPDFFGKLLPNEEFDRLHQSQLYRLTDDAVTVAINSGLSLYVIAKIDSADSHYFLQKATVANKAWSARLNLRGDPEAELRSVEIIAVAALRELPEQFDSLPADIWPVAWTRVKIH